MAQAVQPERLCVGCRQLHPKDRLLRVVREPGGEISLDPTGRHPGRGAYLCPNMDCLRQARRQGGFSWSFKGRVDPALYDRLAEAIGAHEEGQP